MIYESHPSVSLLKHLREVAEGAKARLDHPALRHRELLREVAYLVGLAHDIGKYTTYFQAHLHEGKRFEGGLEFHAFPSALFAAYLIQRRLDSLPDALHKEFLPLLAYVVIHRHHGHLQSPGEVIPRSRELKQWPTIGNVTGELRRALAAFQRQLDDLRAHQKEILAELEALGIWEAQEFLSSNFSCYELFHTLNQLSYQLEKHSGEKGALSEEEGARLCLWGQLLFSALIDADKFSAARLSLDSQPLLALDLVERYLHAQYPQPRHELDQHRAAFHQAVRQQVEALSPQDITGQIFSLTAPTGIGKTLAALDAALRIREKLQHLWGTPPRIVYALPFINIIEQNYQEFHKVLDYGIPDYQQTPERFLLRHHHLAEIIYRTGNEALPLEQALLMTEAWESEIIVTTFVQLFQTLLGYQNRFLKKLHNLIGSVVILDEVQAVPIEYWPLAADVFRTLCRELGLTVIQMTATKPIIFQTDKEPKELHPDPASLFALQRRTRLKISQKEWTLEEWTDYVAELYQQHGSLLVVVNTIGASLRIYQRLCAQGLATSYGLEAPQAKEWLVYLSTNIIPKQRRERLDALKEHLRSGGRALVVSTQVIEAGVNIDFPAVVRDLGPLDSIVQVAGRCNREGNLPRGEVYVLPLQEGGCTRVYGAIHIHVARCLLEEKSQLEEPEYAQLVEQYFHEVQRRISQQKASELWQAYCRLRYDHFEEPALSEFHLIESPEQIPIFVALTPKDETWLLQEFKTCVLDAKDFHQRQAAYLRYRKHLHDYMIRPLLKRVAQNTPPALAEPEGLRWIPHKQLQDYYDLETGFRWLPNEVARAWVA